MIANLVNFVAVTVTSFLICQPLTYVYVPVGDGYCGNVKTFETYMAASSLVLDGVIVALPMPLLWNLQMDPRRKWGLSTLFGLGIL